MALHPYSSKAFIARGGHIPAPLQSLNNRADARSLPSLAVYRAQRDEPGHHFLSARFEAGAVELLGEALFGDAQECLELLGVQGDTELFEHPAELLQFRARA